MVCNALNSHKRHLLIYLSFLYHLIPKTAIVIPLSRGTSFRCRTRLQITRICRVKNYRDFFPFHLSSQIHMGFFTNYGKKHLRNSMFVKILNFYFVTVCSICVCLAKCNICIAAHQKAMCI